MDYGTLLRQAWNRAWHYRALWVFGIVLALTTASWSAAALGDWDGERWDRWEGRGVTVTPLPGETFWEAFRRTVRSEIDRANRELDAFLAEEFHIYVKSNVIVIAGVLLGIALLVAVVTRVARYVSEVALIRMVSEAEATGERRNVWQGFRLGWSASAWRILIIRVILALLGVLVGLVLFGLILGPLPLWVDGSEAVIFVGAFTTAGLLMVAIAAMIVFGGALSAVRRLAWRACAVEGLGVMAAIGRGWAVTRRQLKDVGLLWLITAAVGWLWHLAMVPVVLLLLGVGVMGGGLPAVLAGGLAGLVTSGDTPIWIAVALGVSIFMLVLIAPLVFLSGLREVFLSSVWTLAYQGLQPMGALQQKAAPEQRVPGLGAAPVTQ